MNLPNRITLARISACPVIAVLILLQPLSARVAAFVLFLLAAFSDIYDGMLARRHSRITLFGKLADPLADKLLIAVTLVPLAALGELPLWLVLIVLGRELVITLFRRFALSRGRVISASRLGKAKTLSQNWLVGTVLAVRILRAVPGAHAGQPALWSGALERVARVSAEGLVWIVVALTLLSLVDYLYRNRALVVGEAA